jgi:hypothetical protein
MLAAVLNPPNLSQEGPAVHGCLGGQSARIPPPGAVAQQGHLAQGSPRARNKCKGASPALVCRKFEVRQVGVASSKVWSEAVLVPKGQGIFWVAPGSLGDRMIGNIA